ncbi:hypothetical protein [Marinoscillum sp. MHG1-6]|uniref:hypothetical protein n=1 Tax=Marinoscillum sp. MHG1-6 TaxID=2959627 RepID=UPI0021587543|nr:hypothetical protein [Marinoscillum sp. MHG1-6]
MALKASNYKNWCGDNISPQAWTRVVLKCLTLVRERGLSITEMEQTDPDIELDEELLEAINQTLLELYDVTVDETLLVRY